MSTLETRAERLRTGRTPYVQATVVRAERPTSAKAGDRALVLPDGTVEGFVGGHCAEATIRAQGLRLLRTGTSTLLRITPTESAETVSEGLVTVGNPCLSGGSLDVFLEAMVPPMLVHVHGNTPVARALIEVGRALGHEVRPFPDPASPLPEDLGAVIVASHGRDEEPVLTAAIRAGVPYIGLIASRKRGEAVVASLDGGVVSVAGGCNREDTAARSASLGGGGRATGGRSRHPDERRPCVYTPAGLDIGARTAAEIAVSVYAQVIAERPRVDG